MFRVAAEISRLVIIATTAVAVTAWPATPSVMPRLAAIGVSRLAGRNSAVTRPNTPRVSENTAPQAGCSRVSPRVVNCMPPSIVRSVLGYGGGTA